MTVQWHNIKWRIGRAVNPTYSFGSQKCHAGDHPTALRSAESEGLVDAELVHHLEGHDGRVPVGEVLDRAAGGAMAERLDGQQVDGVSQRLAVELVVVEGDGGAHGVDEHDGGLGGVDLVPGETVAGRDAAEVGNLERGRSGHLFFFLTACWCGLGF